MHHHCEIIIPPTDDIESAIKSIMKPFDENQSQEDHDHNPSNTFYDWYVIGGRWAGTKLMAGYDQEKIKIFKQWLQEEKITVSGLQAGKQALSPEDQIPKVDAKWNEMFPSDAGELMSCPMFAHSNDQYGRNGDGTIQGDICNLKDALAASCSRVIFAGPSYDSDSEKHTGPLEATYMLCGSQWNGVNYMDVKWDGKVKTALEMFVGKLSNYGDEYRERVVPKDEWLVVTVDYHS